MSNNTAYGNQKHVVNKPSKSRNLSVYSNLAYRRRTKKDASVRKRAEYLASLPKHPLKRALYRLHPKRVWAYWFSRRGAFMLLKIAGIGVLLVALSIGALFAYYRKDIDAIRPGQLAKNVRTTVNKYYARDGKTLLWEDKGSGNYTLVVDGDKISKYMKQATISIEDRDFYKHGGISITGTARALVNNAGGGGIQGGSTLTQQLVKQVFFASEAGDRSLGGVPRKIKEAILSIEVERMYNKDEILNLYLNESPYGGRRNGVESGAQAYFHKSANDLTIGEAALLASIPQNPTTYDPQHNPDGHDALIARQHKVLDNMVEQGYITKAEGDKAKAEPIIDTVQPDQEDSNRTAPHFLNLVRSQLEDKLGKATVGAGGLTITTTLDADIQAKTESEMARMFNGDYAKSYAPASPTTAGFSNGAVTVEDTKTGQIIAMMGSRDYTYPGYGQTNAATAFIQPGSSIKPLVYAQLFQNQGTGKQNFGSGSVLADTKTDFGGGYSPNNADKGFLGSIPIRKSLDLSRNIPAIKAMAINEQNAPGSTWKTIRAMGDTYYCTQGEEVDAGLSSAIGGCGTRQVDHVNAIASLGRMGVYEPWTTILEAKNSSGQVLLKYKDASKQVVDPQAAYVVNDILGDTNARTGLLGAGGGTPQLNKAGVKVAVKTGTTDRDGKAKDIWTVAYTPNLTMAVWLGNNDNTLLKLGYSTIPSKMVDPILGYATQVYIDQGKAKASDWFTRPSGIQTINGEIYPSYYNKTQAGTSSKLTFDKVSKKKATNCTPDSAQISLDVIKSVDPFTKKEVYVAPDGYDATKDDDVHRCEDEKPSISGGISINKISGKTFRISVNAENGTAALKQIDFNVGSANVSSQAITAAGTYSTDYTFTDNDTQSLAVTVTDALYYSATVTANFKP